MSLRDTVGGYFRSRGLAARGPAAATQALQRHGLAAQQTGMLLTVLCAISLCRFAPVRCAHEPICDNRCQLTRHRSHMSADSNRSAERTLRVFEYFDRVERSAGVMELADALQMPRSTAAALVSSLVQMGYLSHDRVGRTYMPTMKLAHMGRWIEAALLGEDRDALVPLLHEVARKVDETVVLGVQDDLFAQYVHVELAQRPVLYFQRVGARRPMCRSAVGWALLSLMRDDEVQRLVSRHNQYADDKAVTVAEVMAHVQEARSKGYAFSQHAYLPGVGMLALPITSPDGARRYALGAGGPVERLQERETEVARALRACASAFAAKRGRAD